MNVEEGVNLSSEQRAEGCGCLQGQMEEEDRLGPRSLRMGRWKVQDTSVCVLVCM